MNGKTTIFQKYAPTQLRTKKAQAIPLKGQEVEIPFEAAKNYKSPSSWTECRPGLWQESFSAETHKAQTVASKTGASNHQ